MPARRIAAKGGSFHQNVPAAVLEGHCFNTRAANVGSCSPKNCTGEQDRLSSRQNLGPVAAGGQFRIPCNLSKLSSVGGYGPQVQGGRSMENDPAVIAPTPSGGVDCVGKIGDASRLQFNRFEPPVGEKRDVFAVGRKEWIES